MAVLTADDVMAWRFQTTMLRAGYDQGVVDIFLDQVVDALQAREAQAGDDPGTLAGILTSQEVRATRLPCGRFRQGYLKEEVDALMAQIADTLQALEASAAAGDPSTAPAPGAGSTAASYPTPDRGWSRRPVAQLSSPYPGVALMTAEDVLNQRFQVTFLKGEGYEQDEVDEFLDEVRTALQAYERTGPTGTAPSRPVTMLQAATAQTGAPGPRLSAQQVRSTRFSVTRRFHQGYAAQEVDAFMERIAAALQAYEEHARGSAPL